MPTPRLPQLDALPDSARRVYLELLRYGAFSRAKLAERMGLSPASLTRVTAPLLERGLVTEGTPIATDVGRPSIPLDINLDGFLLIGVSITHERVIAIATNARVDIIASRSRALATLEPRHVLNEAARLIDELRTEMSTTHPNAAILAVGVSIGGFIDNGMVRHAPFLAWDNVPAKRILEDATGLPIILSHDLTALAEAENWFGLGLETSRFIVLTVGIGTGFALVMDSRVITDENTGFGTITDPILGSDWVTLTAANAPSDAEASRAARLVGRLAGTAAAFTMARAVVISGEGAAYLAGHEEELDAGIAEIRHRHASGLDVQLRENDFAFWARGAATSAIQRILTH